MKILIWHAECVLDLPHALILEGPPRLLFDLGMSVGQMHRQGFTVLFEQFAGIVTVYREYGSERARSFEIKAMKNNEKNRLDKVMFQFDRQADVQIEDVIQQKNSRDLRQGMKSKTILWTKFILFEAKVRKYPGMALPRHEHRNVAITVQGDLIGGVQVNSPHSSQRVGVENMSTIAKDVAALRELLNDRRIPQIDREDACQALERAVELSKRERNSDVVKRTTEKLDFVKGVFAVAKDIPQVAGPYIDSIARLSGS